MMARSVRVAAPLVGRFARSCTRLSPGHEAKGEEIVMPGKKMQRHLRWTPPGPYSPSAFDVPAHDPPLAPRDEAVFLLHTGAEIEHALLVQYLYAAYSLKSPQEVPPEHAPKVQAWRKTLLGIAREEMGHLITVQN